MDMHHAYLKDKKASYELCTWQQVRSQAHAVNPELAAVIDSISPDDSYRCVIANYPFGADIMINNELQLPTADGHIAPISHPDTDKQLQQALAYAINMPIGLMLAKTLEVYWQLDNQVLPLMVASEGRLLSLMGMLQQAGTSLHTGGEWFIRAGARSVFFLSKISDTARYAKFSKAYGLQTSMPTSFLQQSDLLREVYQKPQFEESWNAKVLFFAGEWIEALNDPAFMPLKSYLLETAWRYSSYARDFWMFNLAYSMGQIKSNLRPNPYLSDVVRHLYSMAAGAYPGFCFANDDRIGPLSALKDVFHQDYGFKVMPTMVHPSYVDQTNAMNPIYYSLEIPTQLSYSPRSLKKTVKMREIREMNDIMVAIRKYVLSGALNMLGTPLEDLVSKMDYRFYHSSDEEQSNIYQAEKMALLDESLLAESAAYPEYDFCARSAFVRGCVRMAIK